MKPVDLPSDFSSDSLRREISDEAGRCVSCGLCVPHCPTYRITLSEADSPRGRIALMSGVAAGRIPMNPRFALHIDRCLTCRACEAICPNNVRFGQLIDDAREMITSTAPDSLGNIPKLQESGFRRWVEHEVIAKPSRIDAVRPLLRFYQRSGLQKWVRKSNLLGKTKLALLEAQVPFIDKPRVSSQSDSNKSWSTIYPSIGKSRGDVGLFLGCVARLTDVATLNSTIFVLNRLGYTVHVPPTQTCCGALHQHKGDVDAAAQLEQQNAQAFHGLDLSVIISTASGCGVQLSEYSSFSSSQRRKKRLQLNLEARTAEAKRRTPRVMDISEFLAEAEGWGDVKLQPLPHKILVHEPCSLRNVLRASAYSYSLLARIPQARVAPLAGNDQCCGAAGTYFFYQSEISAALLQHKITALRAEGPCYLATSNVGCAMHIAAGLRQAGLEMEVIHPVTLIARQMGTQFLK